MIKKPIYLLGCLLALSWPLAAGAAVHEYRLDNGLKLLVKEDHRAPVVVSQVWYKAGSMDEFNGTTGVAHVLEHMMFKGTAKVPAGEFSKRIAAAGGSENAFTNRDYTAYFQTLEKSKLPLAFELESDRMAHLSLADGEFAKEIKVVMEERRMRTEDNPQSKVYEQLVATAFEANPYHHPVIGWMDDLEHMTAADARAWYRRWYAPNNAVLVVVGDVDPEAVYRLAKRYFGPLKPHALPLRKPQREPRQLGTRRIDVKAPAQFPSVMLAYHAPALRQPESDWQPYALEVLAAVLDGNPAARLNRHLVREQRLASEVGADYDPLSRGPALFIVEGTPSEGKTVADLEAAIRAEIKAIQDRGITADELARVKSQVIANQVYQQDSVFYQAMQIGMLETIGLGYKTLDTRLAKLQQVTAEQVQEVARKYLVSDDLTVGTLDPLPLDKKKSTAATMGGRHDF
ncbi:MAG: insulinase family protein [Sulfuricellaceae bacterium]|nr:insulinase family protein [Sulfuricellaceae bacterium]